ncbi:MAG: hypothetical protein ACPG4X_20995 [Pikeienuella sp.]
MTDDEWRSSILRRVDRLESADAAMQKEISEIKASVRESKVVVDNLETMQAERFRHLEEKFTSLIKSAKDAQAAEMRKANEKSDAIINSIGWFFKTFWGAIIVAAVAFILKGGLVI